MTTFGLNGTSVSVDLPGEVPLLWVLRDHLGLTGTKFGCGAGQCGACTVHVNGAAVRSCKRSLASVEGAQVVTIEGLAGGMFHPLQKHWVQEQVPQCGYCQPGTIMQAAALLAKNPDPTDEEILKGMNSIVCRCMTYDRMKEAIKGAASEMRSGDGSVPAASPGGTDRVVFERQASDAAPNGSGHRIQTLWFEMEPTGLTTVNVSKTEIGQHVGTALAQALAEELEVRWEDVRVRYASSAPEWGLMITGGSWSINWTFDQMSRVGAAGRIALIEAGARLLGVDPAQCKAEESRIVNISTGGAVSYGEILQKVEVSLNLEENALKQIVLKKPEAYKLVGRSVAALDIPGKVDGSAEYTIDVVRPGMVYGHPVTPPVRYGAKVLNVDPSEARKLPGFIDYVLIDDPNGDSTGFVVAVAESYPAAMEAAKALKVEWDLGPNADVDSAALREAAAALAEHPVNVGNWVLDGEADKYYPVGSGEPATTVVAPAIANAIARAVGARVRDLPITPEKVKGALVRQADPFEAQGTGKYVCDTCGYIYDPAVGAPDSGIAPGTRFEDLPDDWQCPLCGATKADFQRA